jgi:gas vesicle protein
MHKEHTQNGFLIGFILGAACVFFFGTKKGKQIFKTITENSIEKVSELKELLVDDEDEYFSEEEDVDSPIKEKHNMKRLFKGVKKP